MRLLGLCRVVSFRGEELLIMRFWLMRLCIICTNKILRKEPWLLKLIFRRFMTVFIGSFWRIHWWRWVSQLLLFPLGLIAILVPHLSDFCIFRPLTMKLSKTILHVYTRLHFWFSIQFHPNFNSFWIYK